MMTGISPRILLFDFFKKISIGKFEYPKIWFCNFLQVEISMVLQNLLIFINTAFDSELIKIGRRVLCTLTSIE